MTANKPPKTKKSLGKFRGLSSSDTDNLSKLFPRRDVIVIDVEKQTKLLVDGDVNGNISTGVVNLDFKVPIAIPFKEDRLISLLRRGDQKRRGGQSFKTIQTVDGTIVLPFAVPDSDTTSEDVAVATNVLANDLNLQNTPLTVTIVTSATSGSLVVNGNNTITYTPTGNFSGTDSYSYRITDAQGRTSADSVATVSLTISAVNDAPINSVPATQSVLNNATKVFSTANGNLISVADVDIGSGNLTITLAATDGTITLAGTSGLSFSVGDGTADATMTFTGTIANCNTALDGLIFTPTASFVGTATITVTSNDNGNTGSGGSLTDVDVVSITVTAAELTPADLNAFQWWRADTGVHKSATNKVSTWDDIMSGTVLGNAGGISGPKFRPSDTNGEPALHFQGVLTGAIQPGLTGTVGSATAPMTVAMVFRFYASASNIQNLMAWGSTTVPNGFALTWDNTAANRNGISIDCDSLAGGAETYVGSLAFPYKQFASLIVIQGSTGSNRMYFNGVETPLTDMATIRTPTTTFVLGNNFINNHGLSGSLQDISLYRYGLSGSQPGLLHQYFKNRYGLPI